MTRKSVLPSEKKKGPIVKLVKNEEISLISKFLTKTFEYVITAYNSFLCLKLLNFV